ncbi:S8 family serine peptidase [Natronosporangium hydrolyticum]|uniref:S8 family serine peptidase n=1 Tax=Natronosporangium hydrolyticum TaxID=2811111 RepID=A0A895YBI8_9ACTN|nr:S8 family serine peptidase [Natronosporangium hydrolyticum]QSB13645.1 S8 family serine peptidase [Natronosporangium hydrolyticum]
MPQPAAGQPSFGDNNHEAFDLADPGTQFSEESATGQWIVALDAAPLAAYRGDVPGLAATSPSVTGAAKLDVDAPHSAAYLDHLAGVQDEFIGSMEQTLDRSVTVAFQYRNVLNGMAVEVSAAEAAELAQLPGVASVTPDEERELTTDVSHSLIGSPSFWEGDTGTGVATHGEGVVVGMLDTGVNPDHPSFAEVDGEGYAHENPYGSGTYVGVCDPDHPAHDPVCNDKLIGAWNFNTTGPNYPSIHDWDSHGSHVGGTIAGNRHDAVFTFGQTEFTRTVQGVAPRANVISYLVCDPGCPGAASVAAVNQAVEDGVDVLNYSISGVDNPWADPVDLAFLDAFEAGMVVSASAGNAGPNTVAKTGPWNLTVAASTHERIFAHTVDVPGEAELSELPAVPGDGPQLGEDLTAELRAAEGNPLGCTPFDSGVFDGAIALIERGDCTFGEKVLNAEAAGAVGVALYNNQGGPPVSPGGLGPDDDDTNVPAVMLEAASGQALLDHVTGSSEPVTARINLETEVFIDPAWEDVMAGFSSTGPSQFEMLAPTVTAPGVNILAAASASGGDSETYTQMQGTSMSSPHAAGSAALLVALHPEWSPAQVRSALASTADPSGLRAPDGESAADPFNYGSGRVDLAEAARIGLVMDETHANMVAANPAAGGQPRTLNLPAFVDHGCAECSWERTVTSVADTEASYTAQVDAPSGMTVTVEPAEFTVEPGDSVDLTVTVDATGMPEGEWAFADVVLATADAHANGAEIAGVHYPVTVIAAAEQTEAPEITVDPSELSSVQGPDTVVTQELTIGNVGDAELSWEILDEPAGSPGATSVTSVEPGEVSGEASLSTAPSLLRGVFGSSPRVATPEVPVVQDAVTLSHSESMSIVAENSVGCTPDQGLSTTENSYLRHFVLDDFGITDEFDVSEVSFGVEVVRGVSPTVSVNLYEMVDPAGSFEYGNFELIGSAEETLEPMELEVVTVPVSGTAAAGSTLVVEVDVPDLSGSGALFIGSNPDGQTAPSYLASGSCGLPEPTDTSAIGFPGMHVVMSVTGGGDVSEPSCEVPGWLSVSPAAGAVAPGGSQVVEVSFDSAGLADGDVVAGTLCVASDDPESPVVEIPVELVVEEVTAPVVEVSPGSLSAEVPVDGVVEQELSVGNTGDATLDWEIHTAEAPEALASDTLFDSGPFVTHPGAGPDGSDHSTLQSQTLEMLTLGANVSAAGGFRVADVFTVDEGGWQVDGLTFYGYQTGSSTTSSFTAVNYQIWDGPPDEAGSSVVFGDSSTNQLRDTGWTNAYRISETAVDTTRPIMFIEADGEFELAEGTYWIDWQLDGSVASGPWQPPITILGETTTGAAKQWTGTAWQEWVDTGTLTQQGAPFTLTGVPGGAGGCAAPGEVSWLSVSPASGSTEPGGSSSVAVSFDAAGVEPGDYEALLCVASNDPASPVVEVPVSMSVVESDGPGEPVVCDETITGVHAGALTVTEGVTCLAAGAQVLGEVNVSAGAGLVATAAVVQGPVSAVGAAVVDLSFTQVTGPVVVSGATGSVSLFASQVTGSVSVVNGATASAAVVAGNTIIGSLSCLGNDPAPTDLGLANTATGGKLGQCAEL